MLLRTESGGALAIGQPSHAWLSGQLARAWGNDRFPAPEPWEEVCLAAEQHDVGWAEWDLEPSLDPQTGLPYGFMELPLEVHIALWRDGPRKLLAQSRYAALLASMHGHRLYRRRDLEQLSDREADLIREYLAGEEALQQQLVDSLRADPAALARNSQLIWIWDFISLVLCLDSAPRAVRDVPTYDAPVDLELARSDEPRRLSLDPWPFAQDGVSVRCEGWRLTGPYESDGALRGALATAACETIEFELRAG
jgi:hypothetical protein